MASLNERSRPYINLLLLQNKYNWLIFEQLHSEYMYVYNTIIDWSFKGNDCKAALIARRRTVNNTSIFFDYRFNAVY